ncbi:hypothetical protein [Akkermansia sp.]|uniref:hypothetical protein n=1 Tax=Akkermansia sp. TaxID=1872421 RepID=UPI0025C5D450|nr:hypothetical protein [Akkermansia sp.]MCC8147753.1 hypothetical protein [Akkermansia sp.]
MIKRKKKKVADASKTTLSIVPENIPEEVQNVPHEMQMQAIKLAQKGMGDLKIIEFFKAKGHTDTESAAAAVGVKIYLGKQFNNFIPVAEVLRGIHMTDGLITECAKIHDTRGMQSAINMRLNHVKTLAALLRG